MTRRRKADFTGRADLGYLKLTPTDIFVNETNHSFIGPQALFAEQGMPLLVVEFRGFNGAGRDTDVRVLMRPEVAGQLVSAIIANCAANECIEDLAEVINDELRHITTGNMTFGVHPVDVQEN